MAIAGGLPSIGSAPIPKHKEWNYSVGPRPIGDETSSTKNPHYPGVKKAFWVWLNRWYEAEGKSRYESADQKDEEKASSLAVIDLGCGTGEITESLVQWHHLGRYQTISAASSSASPLNNVAELGATLPTPPPPKPVTATPLHPILQTNMKQNAIPSHRPAFIPPNRRRAPGAAPPPVVATPVASTSSPVEPDVTATSVQLVGGQYSSLVTPPNLPERLKNLEVLPILTDEATLPAFLHRLPNHTPSPLPLTFSKVTLGKLPFPTSYTPSEPSNPFPKFDFVVCSFGLHLVGAFELRNDGVRSYGAVKVQEKKKMDSELFALLWELSGRADWLVVLGTSKKPAIRDGSGWVRWDLANWAPARHQGFGGKKGGDDDEAEDDEDEDEDEEEASKAVEGAEEVKDSAIELIRDRVRLRVYKSVNGSA